MSKKIANILVDWTVISYNDPNFKMIDYENWDGVGIMMDIEVPNF